MLVAPVACISLLDIGFAWLSIRPEVMGMSDARTYLQWSYCPIDLARSR